MMFLAYLAIAFGLALIVHDMDDFQSFSWTTLLGHFVVALFWPVFFLALVGVLIYGKVEDYNYYLQSKREKAQETLENDGVKKGTLDVFMAKENVGRPRQPQRFA